MLPRISYSEIQSRVESTGRILLTTESEYINTSQKVKIKCGCAREIYQFVSDVLTHYHCRSCRSQNHIPFSEIQTKFTNSGCILLLIESEYRNTKQRVKYICNCKRESIISVDAFLRGHRCKRCAIETQKKNQNGIFTPNYGRFGDENPNWSPDRSTLYCGQRGPLDGDWVKSILKRDEYICQACTKHSNLKAHHIYNYADYPELRLEISNGITFCEFCHIYFHQLFGYGKNSQAQLDDFLRIMKVQLAQCL
jgi:hypothetical protein